MNMKTLCAMACAAFAFTLTAGETAPAPYDYYLRLFREDPEALRKIYQKEVKVCNECAQDSSEFYKELGLNDAGIKVYERAFKRTHDQMLARAKKAAKLVAEGKLVYTDERPKKGIRSEKGKFHILDDLLELDIRNLEQDADLGAFLEVVKTVASGELTFAQQKMVAFAPLDSEVYEQFLPVYDKVWKAGNMTRAGSTIFAYQFKLLEGAGSKSEKRPASKKSCEKKKDPALDVMTMRANGVKVQSFAVKPPMTLKDALAKLQKSAPGVPIQAKPFKDGTTPAVPQVQVGDASVYETAKILCDTVDYSIRITPQGILAEPKN